MGKCILQLDLLQSRVKPKANVKQGSNVGSLGQYQLSSVRIRIHTLTVEDLFLLLFACSVNKRDAAHVALHPDLDHISEFKEKRANVIS